jgi:hypothetical protein
MTGKKAQKNNSEIDDEQPKITITENEEQEIDELPEQDEAQQAVELSDIPIEQFLKDPKMSMITEEAEAEETTAWCPVCNEHTIFADKVCTVCGFTKGLKKTKDKDEEEESTESTFDLVPNEDVIDEMNVYGGYGYEDRGDD